MNRQQRRAMDKKKSPQREELKYFRKLGLRPIHADALKLMSGQQMKHGDTFQIEGDKTKYVAVMYG